MRETIYMRKPKDDIERDLSGVGIDVRKEVEALKKQLLLKHSRRIIGKLEVAFYDQDGDNFIRNLVTIVAHAESFKVPRIIKTILLR